MVYVCKYANWVQIHSMSDLEFSTVFLTLLLSLRIIMHLKCVAGIGPHMHALRE